VNRELMGEERPGKEKAGRKSAFESLYENLSSI
jgi:hypothetical protein